jgi:hypothetical protein
MSRFFLLSLALLCCGCLSPDLTPRPTPVPPDPPAPVIDIDPGRFGLAEFSQRGMLQVRSPQRAREAVAIAEAHRAASTAATAQRFVLVEDLHRDLAKRIAASLSADARQQWKPWQAAVGARLQGLQERGEVVSVQDWCAAFDEIASGLERQR